MNMFEGIVDAAYFVAVEGMYIALTASFFATLLCVVVGMVNLLFRRWLTAGQMSFLWGLVLVRLVIPIGPDSSMSLHGIYGHVYETFTLPVQEMHTAKEAQVVNLSQQDHVYSMQADPWTPANGSGQIVASSVNPAAVWELSVPVLWLIAGLATIAFTLGQYMLLVFRLRRLPRCEDARIRNLWRFACDRADLWRTPEILLYPELDQPAVTGLLWPKLLLPDELDQLSDEEFTLIFLHEAAHLKRMDILVNWLMVGVRALHWWNPVYWLAASRYQNLREQSRDAMVLKWSRDTKETDYADLLIQFAERAQSHGWQLILRASLIGFVPRAMRKLPLANRIRAIRSARRAQHWSLSGVAMLSVLMIFCAGFTSAKTPLPETSPSSWLQTQLHRNHSGFLTSLPATDSKYLKGPFSIKKFDATATVSRIAEVEGISFQDAFAGLETLLVGLVSSSFGVNIELLSSDLVSQQSASQNENELKIECTATGETAEVVVNGSVAVHEEVQRLLQAWQKHGLRQIAVETRFVTSTEEELTKAGLQWNSVMLSSPGDGELAPAVRQTEEGLSVGTTGVVQESVPFMTKKLSAQEMKAFVNQTQSSTRSNIMQAPKVTLFNSQQAVVSDAVIRPFVTGMKPGVNGTLEPQLDLVREGLHLRLQADLNDAGTVQLSAQLTLSSVDDVMTFTSRIDEKDVTIQLPTVRKLQVGIDSELDGQESVVIACAPTKENREFFYLLLTPRLLPIE